MKLLNYYGVVSKRPLGFKLGVPFFFFFSFCFFSVYVLVRGKRRKTGDSNPNHMWTSDCHLGFTYTLHFFLFVSLFKSDFYLLQYIITAGDIHYKETNNCFPTLFFIKLGHF